MLGYITGLRALLAAQIGMRTSGNNSANASTPGYSRQRIQLVTAPSIRLGPRLLVGTGVDVTQIDRVVDPLLDARIRVQERALGRYDLLSQTYGDVEVTFQEPSEDGLNARLSEMFTSLTSLTTSPQDTQLRSGLLQAAASMTERLHLLATQTEEIGRTLTSRVEAKVADVNRLAESLAAVNRQIVEESGAGGGANEARDTRDLLLSRLSRIVDADVLEQPNGSVTVLISGQILVSEYRTRALEFVQDGSDSFQVRFRDSAQEIRFRDGELAGLVEAKENLVPDVVGRLDTLARGLIYEFNRVHSTGTPRDGGFETLTSGYAVSSAIGTPERIPLADAGLPFPPSAGDLYVTVAEDATGSVRRSRLSIDPEHQSLSDLADLLSGVEGITAAVDGLGRLRIDAERGIRFDFSTRLDPNPDDIGSFGGARATLSGSREGPFALADGEALTVAVDGQPAQTVTFQAADFRDIGAATAEEVAAAISAQTTGIRVSVVSGRVVLQSATEGSAGSLELADAAGDPLGTLGLPTGPVTGNDEPVTVAGSGSYTGPDNRSFRFVASSSGEIGVTDGLAVDVFDDSGKRVATLEVGAGYVPGTEIPVTDGISVTLSEGTISADSNDFFVMNALAESDAGGILASLGLNAFFVGTDASNIEVAESIRQSPELLSGGVSGAPGDGQNFLRLLDLQQSAVASLGSATFQGYYGTLVADIGAGGVRTRQLFDSQSALADFLARQRDAVSGVSLDEEAVQLLQFQRSFEAATRYIQAVDNAMNEILDLVR